MMSWLVRRLVERGYRQPDGFEQVAHEFGRLLENHGFQYLRLRWGKVREDRILADLAIVHTALELITQAKTA